MPQAVRMPFGGSRYVPVSETGVACRPPALGGTRIAIETVLRLSGRNGVKIAVERAPDGAKMRATWKV